MNAPLLCLLVLVSTLALASSQQECEVCIKVIEDVRAAMGGKAEWKNKSAVEEALGKYCKKKVSGIS